MVKPFDVGFDVGVERNGLTRKAWRQAPQRRFI
jgi:hypothetical protein